MLAQRLDVFLQRQVLRRVVSRSLVTGPLKDTPNNPLLARMERFSLHAATVCEPWQRSRPERLCRYITRPPPDSLPRLNLT